MLNSFVTPTVIPAVSSSNGEAKSSAYAEQMYAAKFAICGATQVHMLANQLALLRPSELSVSPTEIAGTSNTVTGKDTGQTSSAASHAHFFRGCEERGWTSSHAQNGVAYGAWQVVAYHDPNDLLSYYTSDKPGTVGIANTETTNVVVPYAPMWIPFLFADPITAYTGQAKVPAIMDFMSCGRTANKKPERKSR